MFKTERGLQQLIEAAIQLSAELDKMPDELRHTLIEGLSALENQLWELASGEGQARLTEIGSTLQSQLKSSLGDELSGEWAYSLLRMGLAARQLAHSVAGIQMIKIAWNERTTGKSPGISPVSPQATQIMRPAQKPKVTMHPTTILGFQAVVRAEDRVMHAGRLDVVLLVAATIALAADAGALAASGPAGISGPVLAAHVAAKWLLLGAAVWLAFGNASLMGAGSAIGRAWRFFGLGIGAYLVAELGEAFYQFALGILNPFPSVLDVFYVGGYPLLSVALVGFMRAYATAGYAMGTARGQALVGGALVVVGLAVVWPVYGPDLNTVQPLRTG